MAAYSIPHGTENWDVPLNADLEDIDTRLTTGEATNDAQNSSIATNTSDIATNAANIVTNTTDIGTLQGQMTVANANIATNTSNIATNTTDIGTLQGQMTVANANIATNTSNIATNTTDIASVTTTANNAVPKGTLVVNVQDFGANPGNTGDQAAAINSAVTALGGNGGVVYFPPGNYRLNSSTVVTLPANTSLVGAGPGASAIIIGPSFTGAQAVNVTGVNAQLRDIAIKGASSTVTSNPVAEGVASVNNQNFKVINCAFQFVNGYAIRAYGDTTNTGSGGTTLHGGGVSNTRIESCAGGIWVRTTNGGAASGVWPTNFQIADLFTRFLGVSSGGSANLDGIRIEDCGDVLLQNVITWVSATTGGTGSALRVAGNCAAIFIENLDALGPQTGVSNVQIESNGNGDPQNIQIIGGVIQQGGIGLNIVGATQHVRVENVRILNNQTHGVAIGGTAQSVYVDKCLFSNNGQGATGNNYDINCTTTGTDVAFLTFNRHSSGTVTVGTPGIQAFHNVTAATRVRVFGANFAGSTGTVANWFAGSVLPNAVHHSTAGGNEFTNSIQVRATGLSGSAKAGTVTANGTTAVTVNTTAITANSVVVFGLKTQSGTAATTAPFMSAVTAGTSFQIKSSAGDTSVYNWIIFDLI